MNITILDREGKEIKGHITLTIEEVRLLETILFLSIARPRYIIDQLTEKNGTNITKHKELIEKLANIFIKFSQIFKIFGISSIISSYNYYHFLRVNPILNSIVNHIGLGKTNSWKFMSTNEEESDYEEEPEYEDDCNVEDT